MKRKFIFAIVFIFIMLPLAAFTKTVISDKELDDVTAEDGVSLDLSQLTLGTVNTAATISWGDGDGYGSAYTSAGFIGTTDNNTVGSNFATFSGTATQIDVGSGAETRLVISPQAVTIGPLVVESTMKLSNVATLSGTQELGRINMQGYTAKITADRIQVFAH